MPVPCVQSHERCSRRPGPRKKRGDMSYAFQLGQRVVVCLAKLTHKDRFVAWASMCKLDMAIQTQS